MEVISSLWQWGLVLYIILVCVLFFGSYILFIRGAKNGRTLEKTDIYGYSVALFFLFLAIGYIVRIYFMFFLAKNESEFIMQTTATYRFVNAMPAYDDGRIRILQDMWKFHMIFVFIGIGFLIFGTEYKIYRKSKYLFTILLFVITGITVFLPYAYAHNYFYIAYISPLAWIIIYINVARKASGSVRRNAIMLVIGVLTFVAGLVLNSGTIRRLIFGSTGALHVGDIGAIFSIIVSPIIQTSGIVITLLALLNKF